MGQDKLMNQINKYYYEIENLAVEIFQRSGFTVKKEPRENPRNVDIISSYSSHTYYVEIKGSTSIRYKNLSQLSASVYKLVEIANNNQAIPVLVVFSIVYEKAKFEYSQKFKNLIIIDLANILYIVKGTELQDKLVAVLPFSVDQIEPKEPAIDLGWRKHPGFETNPLQKLCDCTEGRDGAYKFEDTCVEILKSIFSDDLALWNVQKKSNSGLYRFDLLCRIKDANHKTFWTILESFFGSKYVIFEFKNYSNPITQKEIYTTERYLYKKALRNVAIVIAKNGFDENSKWAAKGSLREQGKLILLITVEDLKEMYNLKQDEQDPSEVLLRKTDEMLAELEK